MSRTCLERVRASVDIAQLALQQTEDDLKADDVNQAELAAILRELIVDADPPGGFVPSLAQLVTAAARRAEQIEPDRYSSCPLHKAAVLINDNTGQRLIWAANFLDPQGEHTL
ncbi:hypothetical protein OG585_52420 (plasmid) [Streptomyces sp. NBC_01340]|uniref:hypothetical protein n=1 Tax=Streptomyces sp. NBC_01340 TaxID=2903830 RepID=UPI002E151809|nr:hypothetical protein OG585_52420 [Streptomyces sp. NBC_01340]